MDAATGVEEGDGEEDVSVVKMKLGGFCKDDALRAGICTLASDLDRLAGQAYLFAILHVNRLCATGLPLPTIDRNLYYRCLLACGHSTATRKAVSGDAALLETLEEFDALRPQPGTPAYSPKISVDDRTQPLASLSITMGTMAQNHLRFNLHGRVRAYLRWRLPRVKACLEAAVGCVLGGEAARDKLLPRVLARVGTGAGGAHGAQEAQDVIGRLTALLPADFRAPLKERKHVPCAKHAGLALPLLRHIAEETERELASRQQAGRSFFSGGPRRRFSLLPTKHAFTRSYVAISNMTLMGLLKRHVGVPIKGDGRGAPHEALWRKYFNLNAVETRHRRFDLRISTDGYGVSVQMRRARAGAHADVRAPTGVWKGRLSDAECRVLIGDARVQVCGVDPGLTDAVTVSARDGRRAKYSSARYYHEGRVHWRCRQARAWNEQTEALLEGLGTSRTVSQEALAAHVGGYLRVERTLHAHRAKYRRSRFTSEMWKASAVRKMGEVVAPRGSFNLVFFGDWELEANCPVRRKVSAPARAVRHKLRCREDVEIRDVDEYLSSQRCSCCHGALEHMLGYREKRSRTEEEVRVGPSRAPKRVRIHKVLHCRNSESPECRAHTTWDRDVNASRNLLVLGVLGVCGLGRPPAFQRGKTAAQRRSLASGLREEATRRGDPEGWSEPCFLRTWRRSRITQDDSLLLGRARPAGPTLEWVHAGCPNLDWV